jgi:hypothetical protein
VSGSGEFLLNAPMPTGRTLVGDLDIADSWIPKNLTKSGPEYKKPTAASSWPSGATLRSTQS